MLLEQGRAEWPAVGHFALVAYGPLPNTNETVTVFPRRTIEFLPAKEGAAALAKFVEGQGGRVTVEPLGTFSAALEFAPTDVLEGRLRFLPMSLFRRETGVAPRWRPTPTAVEVVNFPEPAPPPDSRPWWRRLFGI